MTREEAHARFRENEHEGWLVLLDILYDNKPPQVEITEVFQKWGGLKTDFSGEDPLFGELTEQVYYISAFMCERCGRSGRTAVIGAGRPLSAAHILRRQKFLRNTGRINEATSCGNPVIGLFGYILHRGPFK